MLRRKVNTKVIHTYHYHKDNGYTTVVLDNGLRQEIVLLPPDATVLRIGRDIAKAEKRLKRS